LLKKEEKVEMMILKNTNMNANMEKQAERISSEQKWKNLKTKVTGVLIIIVLFYIIFSSFCGGLALSSCI
jgi:hypothetical protein